MKKGAIYLTAANVAFLLSGYIANIWLGRYLGPSEYGVYGVITTLLTAVNIMQVSGIPQAVSRYIAGNKDSADAVLAAALKVQMLVTIACSAVFFGLAGVIAHILHDPRYAEYLRLMAFVFPAYGILALYEGFYNGQHNFRRQAVMHGVYAAAKLGLLAILVVQFGLKGVVWAFILAPFVGLLFGFKLPHAGQHFDTRKIVMYALPLVGYAFVSTMMLSVDLLSLRALTHSSVDVGYYVAAQNIALVTVYGLSAISQVVYPSVARLMSKGDIAEMRTMSRQAFTWLSVLAIGGSAILYATAAPVIRLLFGSAYSNAVGPLHVLLIGYPCIIITVLIANILNGIGRARQSMIITAVGVAVTLVACQLCIPRFGIHGAAVATTVGAVVAFIVAVTYAIMRTPLNVPFVTMAKTLVVGLAIAASYKVLAHANMILLPVLWLGLFTVFGLGLLLVQVIRLQDLMRMVHMAKSKVAK